MTVVARKEWNPYVTGVIVAFFSVMIMAWWRPWGAVGAIRNWGDWIMYGVRVSVGTVKTASFNIMMKPRDQSLKIPVLSLVSALCLGLLYPPVSVKILPSGFLPIGKWLRPLLPAS